MSHPFRCVLFEASIPFYCFAVHAKGKLFEDSRCTMEIHDLVNAFDKECDTGCLRVIQHNVFGLYTCMGLFMVWSIRGRIPWFRPSYFSVDGTPWPLARVVACLSGMGVEVRRFHYLYESSIIVFKPS